MRYLKLLSLSIACFLLAGAVAQAAAPAAEETPQQAAFNAIRGLYTDQLTSRDGDVTFLRFSKPIVTDEHLQQLHAFPKLNYLAILSPLVTDAGLEPLRDLPELDTLLLSESGITDAGLEQLASLQKLERLYLANTQITDAGLKKLAALPQLKTLSLEHTAITDAGLAELKALPQLETLLLSHTQITDAGLSHLAALPQLKLLFLSGTAVTGGDGEWLRPLEKLEHLGLTKTAINDASLARLAAPVTLKELLLYGNDLSPAAVAQLRQRLPKTGVHTGEQAATLQSTAPSPANDSDAPPAPAISTLQPPIETRLAGNEIPDFQRHVVPLLGRLGCNGRACHGSFQGQGGFRLSMFGYDFDMDHENLSLRLDLDHPADSLILHKPTSADDHGGGLRLPPGGWEQQLLARWIAGGAPNRPATAPQFERLEITPGELLFQQPGDTVQLQAIAVWSDGSRENVTALTRFQTNDEAVAVVSPAGLVRSVGPGDTHIISFYDNGIIGTPALLPFSQLTGDKFPQVPTPTRIDELVVAKLAKLGVPPSDLSTDEEFLRRVSIDMIGTLPTPAEIAAFVADTSPDKRARKIDELLERPEYVTWWTTRLCDLTGANAGYLGGTEMASVVAAQWREWLTGRVRDNDGWDKIVAGIVLASSRGEQPYPEYIAEQSTFTDKKDPIDYAASQQMPHYWYRSNQGQPAEKALAFGYTFLGVRLECAQCHKHPFDQWSQNDFEQFTEVFSRIKSGVAPESVGYQNYLKEMLGVPDKLNTAATRRGTYLRIAAEGRPIPWNEVYIAAPGPKPQPGKLLGDVEVDLNQYADPRQPLMEWLLNEPNHYFAKAFVNRIWASYFNVGVIHPADDLNLANPPSNKPLLDWLTADFIEHGYDMKRLHRTIANSRTYQLSWRHNATNQNDERNFSRAVIRRLPAEVAVDALQQATAADLSPEKLLAGMAKRTIGLDPRSYQARTLDYSLQIFGKPLRTTNCDCERQGDPTLLQSLYVRNDSDLVKLFDRPDGWLAEQSRQFPAAGAKAAKSDGDQSKQDDAQVVSDEVLEDAIAQAYLRTVSRQPTSQELTDCREFLRASTSPAEGLRDVLWALLNTQEFITNH
ncbi:DUF1549 domain-containing protein [Lignipirellula cremea]|nr:DUF1549 domain-containing protein [Lignipirellula cremea]